MPRFLSAAWFATVTRSEAEAANRTDAPADLVLEQVVRDTPDGTVVYRVEVASGRSRILWPVPGDAPDPDVRISTDWSTAVAVARGQVSTQQALMQGRLRVGGRPDRVAGAATALTGVDSVPPDVREETTFEVA